MANKKSNWIAKALGPKGSLHKALGIDPKEKIPENVLAAAAKKSGRIGKQARLAETLKGLRKKRESS